MRRTGLGLRTCERVCVCLQLSQAQACLLVRFFFPTNFICLSLSRYTGSFEVFDPVHNSWTVRSDAHAARCSASAVVLDRNVYLIGGIMVGSMQRQVERYNQATGWATLASMSIPR